MSDVTERDERAMTAPTTQPLHSRLYVGRVRHRRFAPIENAFTYSAFWLYLDLDELDRVFADRWLWSTSRPAFARFSRADHLVFPDDFILNGDVPAGFTAGPQTRRDDRHAPAPGNSPATRSWGKRPGRRTGDLPPLDESVRQLVEAATGTRPTGPIRLLTQLRYFGYVLNPVSFYYCFDEADTAVSTVVAEVNNTPWGERHCYVLGSDVNPSERLRFQHAKRFHVSPFMDLDMQYRWSLSPPAETLSVHIENWRDSSRLFDVTLHLNERPITPVELARVLVRHPFITGKVATAIYWQALKLWWKRCPFVPHPNGTTKNPQPHDRTVNESDSIAAVLRAQPVARSDSRQ